METGIKGKSTVICDENNCAEAMGSGALKVFATPSMVALMEKAAWESVQPFLEEGQGTVGTLMNVKHLAATPLGDTVVAETELTEVDGRRLVFSVKATDSAGVIGEGVHERFIIGNERFMESVIKKHS